MDHSSKNICKISTKLSFILSSEKRQRSALKNLANIPDEHLNVMIEIIWCVNVVKTSIVLSCYYVTTQFNVHGIDALVLGSCIILSE